MVSMFRAIRFWLLLHPVVSQNLDGVLSLRPELSRFVESLKLFPELELLLKDNDQQVTLLAPSNDAIAKSSTRFDKPLDWKYHLNETIRSHFIVDALLTADALNSLNSIRVLAGHELQVYGENLVEESTLVTVDLQATNGILHIVDSVLPASFDQYSLADLETQTEFLPPPGGATGRPSLVNIVDSVGREDLKPQEELGLTFLGCDSRALENIDQDYDQTINNSPSVLNGELLNKTRPTEEVLHQFVQYNLLQQNFYFDELSDGLLAASLPVGGCGHVWITKQNGRLCFGDACVLTEPQPRTYLASNG